MTDAQTARHGEHGAPIVLVVEDEILIRLAAVESLRDAGFQVVEAASGEEALSILNARDDVGAVFTDVMMPGAINGVALAERVVQRWPHMAIILTSGVIDATYRNHSQGALWEFVAKPYSIEKVIDILRKRLGRNTAAGA